jgi:hypothetical protein
VTDSEDEAIINVLVLIEDPTIHRNDKQLKLLGVLGSMTRGFVINYLQGNENTSELSLLIQILCDGMSTITDN